MVDRVIMHSANARWAGECDGIHLTTRGTTMEPIRFNVPSFLGDERDYIDDVLAHGDLAASGAYSQRCSDLLRAVHGAPDVLMTTSGTSALEMAAMLLAIEPGDVAIVPSFASVSTALAFVRQGATIRFCDIEPTTLGMDPNHLEALLDGSVRAVVPVHYAGVGCEIDEIVAITRGMPHVDVVEDNSQGLFASFRGEPLGSFGRFATMSFHQNETFVSGEGGALVVNKASDVERAHVLSDRGTNRRAALLGTAERENWVYAGSNFGLAEVLAALLFAQLERRETILANRRVAFDRYQVLLEQGERDGRYSLPVVPSGREPSCARYYVLLPDQATRDAVRDGMQRRGVATRESFVPLHRTEFGAEIGDGDGVCPVADDIAARLLLLPLHNDFSESESARVAESFGAALDEAG